MTLYTLALLPFLVSAIISTILIKKNSFFSSFQDSDLRSIQNYHKKPPLRFGGIAIFISLSLTTVFLSLSGLANDFFYFKILISTAPLFLVGVIEDFFKNTPLKTRIFAMLSSSTAFLLVSGVLKDVFFLGFPQVDYFLSSHSVFCLIVLSFMLVGAPNAYNMIDGYHGLSSMTSLCNLAALILLSREVNDPDAYCFSTSLFAATLAIFIFNYPKGKLFLGDCGAYCIGLMIAVICIYLNQTYPERLPASVFLLINIYPFTDAAFTIFRRKILTRAKSTQPDNCHLHHLIYHVLVPDFIQNKNACVMPLMLIFIVPQVVLSLIFHENATLCFIFSFIYFIFYIAAYRLLNKILKRTTPFLKKLAH